MVDVDARADRHALEQESRASRLGHLARPLGVLGLIVPAATAIPAFLNLSDKADKAPEVLSGQRQRLAVHRALANEPTLLPADEPTGRVPVWAPDAGSLFGRSLGAASGARP